MTRIIALTLFCFGYSYAQNIPITVEGVTPTQAIFSYVPSNTSACTVKAVTADRSSILLPDIDPVLFPGSDQDLTRPSTTVHNNRRYVVIGSRTSDKASDGKLYSRALQAATSHLFIVECGATRTVVPFDTKNPPLGSTYPELPPFNAAGFGNYAFPTVDWTDRSKTYIDPVTGLLLRPAIGVSPYGQSGEWGNDHREWQFTDVFDLNQAWSNANNVLSGGVQGPFATYTGAHSDPLFLPFPVFPSAKDRTIAGWYPTSQIWDDTRLTVYGSGSGSVEDRKVLVCLGVFFQPGANQCAGPEMELTLPVSTGSTVTPGFPAFQFKSWQLGRYLTKEEASVPYGTVTVSNSKVTLTDGQTFPLALPAGVKIKIGSTWYTVQRVQDARHLQLQESALTVGPVSYTLGGFGVRIRKKTTTGRIDVAASWTLGWSTDPQAPLNGAADFCSHLTFQVDYEADGVTPMSLQAGKLCILGDREPVLMLLIPATGEMRFLSPLHHQDAGSTTAPKVPLGAFSETDPLSVIGYHGDDEVQSGMALYRVTYDPSQCHFRTLPSNSYGFDTNIAPDCVTWKNLSPNSKGKGIINQFQAKAALNPLWNAAVMSQLRPDFSGVTGNYAMFTQYFSGPQDSPCFMATFDMNTGTVVRVIDSFGGAPDMRWAGCHTTPTITSSKWIGASLSLLRAKNDKGYLGGPFKIRSLDQLSKDGGLTWSNDTTLHAAEVGVCTTTDPKMIAKGATGSHCVKIRISSDYPCNLSPANGDVAKFPCPWDPTLAGPMPLQVGDYLSILPKDSEIDGKREKLLITSKIPVGVGGWELELMRWATCDTSEYYSHVISPYGAEHPNGWDAYMTGTGLCSGDVVWFDATGQDPAFYPDTSNITGGHITLGPAPNGAIAEVAEGGASRIGPIPDQFNRPVSFAMNLFGTTFGGVSVDSQDWVQSYPNVGQWTATEDRKAFAFDLRHYNPGAGTSLEAPVGIFKQQYTLVPGMSQVYSIDNFGGVFGKIYPYLAFAGPYLLKDMSGPQSAITDTDEFRFCVAYKDGECVVGSKAHDAFVNVPRASQYNSGHCVVNTYAEINPCFVTPLDFSSYAIQFKFTEDDPKGVKRRRLTSGFTGPGAQYQYSNTHVTPEGEWAFVGPGWVNGVRPGLMLVKIPPPPVDDGVDRSTFVSIPIDVTAPPPVAAVAGTPQSTPAGTPFGSALQVKVMDASSNPAVGISVTFSAPASGASATFNGSTVTTVLTNAAGIAISPVPVANTTVGGPYTVTATVPGFGPASFSLTNLASPTITVSVSPRTALLDSSGQQAFTAAVTGTANTAVTWSLSPNIGTITGNAYTAPSSIALPATVRLTATSQASSSANDTITITLRPSAVTIFAANSAPWGCNGVGSGTELGVKFRSDTAGQIRGIRFYKSSTDTTPHTGTLWTTAGVRLGTGTFTNETPSGWQQMMFTTSVPITANSTYIASYHTDGWYCSSSFAFSSTGVDNPPLHALKDGLDGPNSVYATTPTGGAVPAQASLGNNYWVDVLFDPAAPQVPGSIAVASGTPQSATAGAQFGAALQASVLDTSSNPIPGVTVTFTAPASGLSATFNGSISATAVTNASGIAVSPVPVANATPGGPYAVTALVSGLTTVQFLLTNTAPPQPASISATGGTGQSTIIGTAFGAALQAKVLDASSNPLAGVTVTFTAPASGASAKFNASTTATAVTNASGIAVSPVPAANSIQGGPYVVTASVAGLNLASFSLTNLPAPVVTVTMSPKTVTLNPSGQQVFTAVVTGTANTAVTWLLSPNLGTMTGNSYTAPSTIVSAQTVTLTATSVADTSAKDTATITLKPADATIFPASSAPWSCSGSGAGTELGLKFRSETAGLIRGIRFYKSSVDYTAHTGTLWTTAGAVLATGSFTGETASGWQQMLFATPVPIAANITYVASYHTNSWYCATVYAFTGAGVDNPPLHALQNGVDGPNSVYATSPSGGVMPAQPSTGSNYWVDVLFAASAPQVPGSIAAVSGTPQSTAAGSSFSAPLQAKVMDTSSNPIAGVTVTFAAPVSGASAMFSGSTVTTAVTNGSGIAVSPVPAANATQGGPYAVTATLTGLSPVAFMLTNTPPPQPVSMTATGGTGQSATVGSAFGAALQAKVLDSASNPAAGVTVTFTAPASGASATFNGSKTATAVTNASGIATSPVPLANATQGGPYTITASVTGLSPASFSLTNLVAPVIGVSVSPKTVTLDPSGQQVFAAAVMGTGNTTVTWSLSPNLGTMAGNTYTAPSTITLVQTVTLTATSVADTNAKDTATITLKPPDVTIFPATAAPWGCNGNGTGTELGMKFRSDTAGFIRGIRFYKSAADSSPHTGALWTTAGAALATGTFTNETPAGWQQLVFATPVAIAANTTYIASYHTNGWYCATSFALLSAGVDNAPLHALKDGQDGPNGVYASGNGGVMPAQGFLGTSYWVDVLFSTANPQVPASVTAVSGTPQSTAVGSSFGGTLQAKVLDASSNPMAGVSVILAAPGSGAGATFNGSTTTTAVTNAAGIVVSPVPAANATQGGPYPVTATVKGLTPAQFLLTNTPLPQAATISAIGGTGQSTTVGSAFGAALQAKVVDSASNPSAGVTVTFTAPASGPGATFSGNTAATAVTNTSGIATSPVPVANATQGGPYSVTASVVSLTPASFSLTNTSPPQAASITAIGGMGQSTMAGSAFGAALQAKVVDSASNPSVGVTVTFTAPASGPGATFSGNTAATAVTNASGIATSPVPVANATPGGPYSVTASVVSLTPASFSLTNLPAPGITVSLSPQTVTLAPSQQQAFVAAVQGTANTAVNWSWSPNEGTMAGNVYTAPRTVATVQTITVTATSVADSNAKQTATITLQPPDATIFAATASPWSCSGVGTGTEMGVKFRSDVPGLIRGIRFYKAPSDSTAHTGTLWTAAGVPLATGPFTNDTFTGWQQMLFSAPVPIAANTTYVASYHTGGWYCASAFAFSSAGVDNPPLHALKDGVDGPNGVYATSPNGGVFPTQVFVGTNYWADVLFAPSSSQQGASAIQASGPKETMVPVTLSGIRTQGAAAAAVGSSNVGTGGVNARIRFGYTENGPPDSFFCTSRQEACVTDEQATPFAYEKSDTLSPTSCASGCTIRVPAISGRVLYYQIQGVDDSGHVTYQGPRMTIAVP